ncbi:pilus assembly protein PilM [Bacillus tianshenii]|uniref:type IV pilus biogenesis protein PilM n=1 Tax=Sutcliffiella tianshenii TaxID=1463404 RepID=UPI001CD5A669|nr:pilus assembly protein PilM [Bacillus tianshenii]MCA1318749.1 pilus assembly protein PilM [Bacillus tianshenii]
MEFSFLQPKHNNFINITFRDHVIRMVELKSLNPLTVKRTRERFLPPNIVRDGKIVDENIFRLIFEECVEEWGLKRKHVRFVVPDQFVVTRKLSIPSNVMDDEIIGHLYLELGSTIHLPFEDPVFDVHVLQRSEKTDLVLFASPEEMVTQVSSIFEENKMKPTVADVSSLCLYRLYYEFGQRNENDHLLIIHFDISCITLSIFMKHAPVFVRTIAIPSDIKTWEVSETNTRMEWAGDIIQFNVFLEDFIKEVERIMNFFRYSLNQGTDEVKRVLLHGDHPNFPLVLAKLRERITVPVDTYEQEVYTQDQEVVDPKFYFPLGLALKEV